MNRTITKVLPRDADEFTKAQRTILQSDARFREFLGGRVSGKTEVALQETAHRAMDGQSVVYVCETRRLADTTKESLHQLIENTYGHSVVISTKDNVRFISVQTLDGSRMNVVSLSDDLLIFDGCSPENRSPIPYEMVDVLSVRSPFTDTSRTHIQSPISNVSPDERATVVAPTASNPPVEPGMQNGVPDSYCTLQQVFTVGRHRISWLCDPAWQCILCGCGGEPSDTFWEMVGKALDDPCDHPRDQKCFYDGTSR